jgi:hypothetical protein
MTFPHSVYACAAIFQKKEKAEDGRTSVGFHLEIVTARSEREARSTVEGILEVPEDVDLIGIMIQAIPDEVIDSIAAERRPGYVPRSVRIN